MKSDTISDDALKSIKDRLVRANDDGVFLPGHDGDRTILTNDLAKLSGDTTPTTAPASSATNPIATTTIGLSSSLNSSISVYYDAAVVVTHRTRRRLIVPLWMVESFSAGDVWLRDGDRIEVVPYRQTEIGGRSATSANELGQVTVTGLIATQDTQVAARALFRDISNDFHYMGADADGFNNQMDVIVLQHLSSNGVFEEYVIPRGSFKSFLGQPQLSQGEITTSLKPGDVVRFDSLKVSPLIREGRSKALAASANVLQDEASCISQASRRSWLPFADVSNPFVARWNGTSQRAAQSGVDSLRGATKQSHDAIAVLPRSIGI